MAKQGNITSANSILMLGISSLFSIPQQLQGFADGDSYALDNVDVTESVMGVDGKKSAGWIPQIKTMNVTLQADSPSNTFFESWYAAQEAGRTIYTAFGTISQDSVGRIYALTNGTLKNYDPAADGGKTLKPRKFSIEFESVIGAAI
jgi:hypothetical protein